MWVPLILRVDQDAARTGSRKFSLTTGAAVALIMATVPAMAYTGQELSKQAKVSITEARAIALKAHPGKITDEELEKEKGGTGLRYSFDIKSGAVTQEVGVDAQTGKVLENKKEGPHPD
jgi:Peptidase propeptide and YPEB domain